MSGARKFGATASICDARAERIVAGWLMQLGDMGAPAAADWDLARDITTEYFVADPVARECFAAAAAIHTSGLPVCQIDVVNALSGRVSEFEIASVGDCAPTSLQFPGALRKLRELHHRRQLHRAGLTLVDASFSGEDIETALHTVKRTAEIDPVADSKPLRERLAERQWSRQNRPPAPLPRFLVAGIGISTPGNLACICAAVKAGKSSFIGAMLAAAVTNDPEGVDCLGVTARNPDGLALLHFDTEQSPADHWSLVDRSLRRAGVDELPPWLHSYCITGFSVADGRSAVMLAVQDAKKTHGGIYAVVIDGIADLVADVNDAEECGQFIGGLHAAAIAFDCPILGIIHLNPGTDKVRGHLGSQLERKAETNLMLEKEDEVTVVWSKKNRKGSIAREQGPRFHWSDEKGMHVSTRTVRETKAEAKRAELSEIVAEVLPSGTRLRYVDLRQAIEKARACGPKHAEKLITTMKSAHVVRTEFGSYLAA